MGRVKPRGYIRISPEGRSYEPLVAPMRQTLRGMALSAGTLAICLGVITAIRD